MCLALIRLCFFPKGHQDKRLFPATKIQEQVLDQGKFLDNELHHCYYNYTRLQKCLPSWTLNTVFFKLQKSDNQTEFPFHYYCIIQSDIALLVAIFCSL